MLLTKQLFSDVKNTNKLKIIKVKVPNTEHECYLKEMSLAEVDAFDLSRLDEKGNVITADFRTRFLLRTLCDEKGTLLFDPDSPQDFLMLSSLPAKILRPLAKKAQDLNGMTDEEIEATEKN
jgi:hypothetical protein